MEETCVITQHADTLLTLFFHGVKDDETTVMKNVRIFTNTSRNVHPKDLCRG